MKWPIIIKFPGLPITAAIEGWREEAQLCQDMSQLIDEQARTCEGLMNKLEKQLNATIQCATLLHRTRAALHTAQDQFIKLCKAPDAPRGIRDANSRVRKAIVEIDKLLDSIDEEIRATTRGE